MGLGLPFWGHSLTSSESNQVHRFFSIVFRIIIAVDTEISCIIIYMIDSKLISFRNYSAILSAPNSRTQYFPQISLIFLNN